MFFCRKLSGKYVTIPEELQERIRKYYKARDVVRYDVIPTKRNLQKRKLQKEETVEVEEQELIKKSEIVQEIEEKLEKTVLTETFQELLFKYIDARGLVDSEVYKKAYVDRRVFSKIRCDINYHPSLGTVILLALSLKLSIEELEKLLETASYSLPQNNESFIVIKFLFEYEIYDIETANNIFYTLCNKNLSDI